MADQYRFRNFDGLGQRLEMNRNIEQILKYSIDKTIHYDKSAFVENIKGIPCTKSIKLKDGKVNIHEDGDTLYLMFRFHKSGMNFA
jgi:hypothetical protein